MMESDYQIKSCSMELGLQKLHVYMVASLYVGLPLFECYIACLYSRLDAGE